MTERGGFKFTYDTAAQKLSPATGKEVQYYVAHQGTEFGLRPVAPNSKSAREGYIGMVVVEPPIGKITQGILGQAVSMVSIFPPEQAGRINADGTTDPPNLRVLTELFMPHGCSVAPELAAALNT